MKKGSSKEPGTDLRDSHQHVVPGNGKRSVFSGFFRDLTLIFGLLIVLSAFLGLIGILFDITLISTVYPGYKTIAFSAALIWIVIGSILAVHAVRPMRGMATLVAKLVLAAIVVAEAIELPFNIVGSHSLIEIWLTGAGRAILGPSSSPMSPVASVLIILTSVSLFFIVRETGQSRKNDRVPDAVGITGVVITVIGFTFVLSYVFGDPFLYGTQFIPIAALSALAASFAGAGLVTAAGPAAVPLDRKSVV
jgi:hypothetical protein